jgi:hypothetical protein
MAVGIFAIINVEKMITTFSQMLLELLRFRVNINEKAKETIGTIIPRFEFAFFDKVSCSHITPAKRHNAIKIMVAPIY